MPAAPTSVAADLLDAPDLHVLSEEERTAVAEKEAALEKLLAEEGVARYKLEVMFSHKHTAHAPTTGIVTWWESGSKLHGGGDAKLYLCDGVSGQKGCGKFIPDSANGLNFVVCPSCQKLWQPEDLVGEIFYRLPLSLWADVLYRWYNRLNRNADIYVKYLRLSIRDAQKKEEEKKLRGELLTRAREDSQRLRYIYPLRNIIKDTSHGADLHGRIKAFLKA